MSYNKIIDGFKNQKDNILEDIIIDYKSRVKFANVFAYIELTKRHRSINSDCLNKLSEFAIQNGATDWTSYFNNFQVANVNDLNDYAANSGFSDWISFANNLQIKFDDSLIPNPNQNIQRVPINIETRYLALRTISNVLTFFAWIIGILAVIVAIALFTKSEGDYAWILPLVTLVTGVILFISLLAYSEIIKVFVDIEENTRRTAMK